MELPLLTAPGDVLFGREKTAWWLPVPLVRAGRFFYLVVSEFNRNRCPEKAASLGFETVLSFVPAIVLALFFVRSFGGMENLSRDLPRHLLHQLNVDQITLTLPSPALPGGAPAGEVHVMLSDKIQEVIETADQALHSSSVSFTSFFGLVLAAVFLTLTLEHSLNDVWSSHGQRGFILKIALSWSILTLGPLLIGVSMYATRDLTAPGGTDFLVRMLGPFFALYLLYKLVPAASVTQPAALLGSAVASAAWVAARRWFGYYLHYAVSVDRLYGALGLLPLFLIWIWVAWMIVLIGAEVSYTFQNLNRLTAIERRRRLAPFVQPGLLALALVLRAAESFRAGKGAVPGAELAETAGLPDQLWARLIALLLEKRILVQAGSEGRGFTLARPADALRVDEIFNAVDEALVARPEDSSSGPTPLTGLSRQLADARRRELGTKTVAQLLDGALY